MMMTNNEKPSTSSVLMTNDRGVCFLTLNRPEKINSFTKQMHLELLDKLTAALNSIDVRCVVINGAGRGFCAGQDLADLNLDPANATNLGDLVGEYFNVLIRTIAQAKKPILAKVHGIAAGAGANLALACDLTIAADNAQFLQAFVNIGLIPDSGGTWFLPKLAGQQRALGLALLGEKISAGQAREWGLIWQTVEAEKLDQSVMNIALRLASLPPRALADIKHSIRAAATNSLDEQLELERTIQAQLGASADYFEGVNAFLQKRPARFTGA